MPPIISVRNLSKRYRLGVVNARALRDELHGLMARFLRRKQGAGGRGQGQMPSTLDPRRTTPSEPSSDFWALRDVSFDIQPGEVVGIIGRNGAGKSTLLKILSRITEPTSGEARIRGRVASLLEVGMGFHPELTGRENIFLNGAILGMTKAEVHAKFDEIVAFAEVERFIDTPVKRYSSGMYVRLAFAVAAHLEPEILIVDEVLAVGDSAFQKKCLGKMEQVSGRDGRTVLFVSHQMAMISNLCSRCILMDQGRVKLNGPSDEVVQAYMSENSDGGRIALADRTDRTGNGRLRFHSVWIEDESGGALSCTATGQTVGICCRYELAPGEVPENVQFAVAIYTQSGVCVTELCNTYAASAFTGIPGPEGVVRCLLPRLQLNRGRYSLNIIAASGHDTLDYLTGAAVFDVEAGDYFGTGRIASDDRRLVMFPQSWDVREAG
jgi:lipopolysaccharide transport system ATP-binding protein